jgi:hypothetical protein
MGKGPKSLTQWVRIQSWRTYGLVTAPLRVLPDFLIIGALKAGTTSLYQYLHQHPHVNPAFKKEIKFYNCLYHRGYFWYRSFFPLRFKMQSNETRFITGEASPNYLFHPKAPQRVAERLPDVKLIVLLRNPIDRAYSHYQMNVRSGWEELTFEEAIEKEPQRLAGEMERILADDRYPLETYRRYSYISKGHYAEHLQRWLEYFPRQNLLVVRSEELFTAPDSVYQSTLAYLGLPAWSGAHFKVYSGAESYQAMCEETRQSLMAYYQPHNKNLYDLLGQDIEWNH